MKREADGLAAKLGIAKQIDAAFLASNEAARRVEKWLGEKRLLVSKLPTQAATLAALAARDSEEEPIPLGGDDTLLRELRDALDELRERGELSASEREELGKQIGANITVDGREWRKGKRVKIAVRPSEAYLPRSIDTTEDGFPAAADRTPGLKWIDPRYSTLFRGDDGSPAQPGEKAEAEGPRRHSAHFRRACVLHGARRRGFPAPAPKTSDPDSLLDRAQPRSPRLSASSTSTRSPASTSRTSTRTGTRPTWMP